MKNKKNILYTLALVAGILILLNILSFKYFVRLDLTEDGRYTLSKATKDILSELDETVTITAYFTEDLPPQYSSIRKDFKEMLVEYTNNSDGKLVYEFIDPNEDEETEQKAMQKGIQPLLINVSEKDQAVQKKAYLGAVVQMGEESDVIPFVQPGAGMEYALSASIKKLSVDEKPTIAFLQGHGEPSLRAIAEAVNSLSVLYNVMPVTLNDSTFQLDNYTTLAMVAPKDTIPPNHLMQLSRFLKNGGNLFLAMNKVDGNLQQQTGQLKYTGLGNWLKQYGITVEDNFVIDASCASIQVQQQQGPFSFATQMQFPYLPVITNFEEHPVTSGLETVILQFASSITFTGDSTVKYVPLAKTSEKSGTQPAPLYFDIEKQWTEADFPLSGLTVAACVEGKFKGEKTARIVIVTDGDFPINGEGQQARQINPDNKNLIVNAIDWLSDDTGLIELRTKGITARPLDEIENSTKTLLKYLNFLLPIILIIIVGVLRVQYNKNKRIKRMQEGYI